MSVVYPTYPVTTLTQAEDMIVFTGNQIHDVMNADATSVIEAEDGAIPSIRKALVDNMYFKPPQDWVTSTQVTDPLQLKQFTDGGWYFAPTATISTPVNLGTTPIGDTNWKPWSKDQAATYQHVKRLAAEAGYNMVSGSFYFGGTLDSVDDVLFYEGDGKYYSWGGSLPKNVNGFLSLTPETSGGIGSEAWVDHTQETLRGDLAELESSIEISGVTAANLAARSATSADVGEERPPLGYSPSADVTTGTSQDTKAMDIIRRGSINLAKKFRGIRRNCGLISARGGRLSTAGSEDFAPLITGVQNSRGIAGYGSVDGVTAYVDATSRAAESWELVTATAFTSNTCTISEDSAEKVKVGDVIKTGGSPVYYGIVTAVVMQVVSVDEWASDSTTVGTPTAPISIEINPVNKIWCLNAIANMESGGRANTAVVAELGVVNNSQSNPTAYPNGVDTIMMPSLFSGGAAFLARGVSSIAKWLYGFRSNGALFNFYSANGADSPHAGFRENSSATVGLKLSDKNTYSIAWNTSTSDVDLSIANCPMLIGNRGNSLRLLNDTGVISASRTLSEVTPTYLVGAGPGITITMPHILNHVGGHYYELLFLNAGSYIITGDVNVNGSPSASITVSERSYHRIVYDGNQWQVF